MKIIELEIPDDLAGYLPAEEMIIERNIVNFLRAYYMKDDIAMPLEQQYALTAEENEEMTSDFIAADLEGWEE